MVSLLDGTTAGTNIDDVAKITGGLRDRPAIDVDAIPQDLLALGWLASKFLPDHGRPGKFKKPPYNPHTGKKVDPTDPANWVRFDDAMRAVASGDYNAAGVVLTKGPGITSIDLDHCCDPATGEIAREAETIIRLLDSYTEYSVSRTGVHILVKASLPDGARNRTEYEGVGVELYDHDRFLIVTGNHVIGTPTTMHERQAELNFAYRAVFGDLTKTSATAPVPSPPRRGLDDEALLQRLFGAANGRKARLLFEGHWTDYNPQKRRYQCDEDPGPGVPVALGG